ncbi:MAG: hypothetical protein KME30_11670 [Iphinoe sp. HA4291-MV1]|nr:hypothetical protein [Iphinoe sp. HA4291-MV1]
MHFLHKNKHTRDAKPFVYCDRPLGGSCSRSVPQERSIAVNFNRKNIGNGTLSHDGDRSQ